MKFFLFGFLFVALFVAGLGRVMHASLSCIADLFMIFYGVLGLLWCLGGKVK